MGADLKFIHCSDLHLDTPFKNVSSIDVSLARRMYESSFKALDRIIDKAIEEKVDFIIFSGDIFEVEYSTPHSRYRFAEAIRRSGVRCYIAYGNHDHGRKWEDSIPLPENAVVFPDHVVNIPYPNEEDRIADVIGVSHSSRHESRDLTEDIEGSSDFSIAVVHCDLDKVSEGHNYAPANLSAMLNKRIDYWALGHIHKRNVVHQFPHVVYPGNTQGRSLKETGEKGAYLVTVSNGLVKKMDFFVTGEIEWISIEESILGMNMDGLLESISKQAKRGSILKIRLTGTGDLDRMIRLERQSFISMVEMRTGCTVASLIVDSMPTIDIEERKRTGDLASSIIISGERIRSMSRNDMIDIICSTKASASVRYVIEGMSDEELRMMVDDATISLLERVSGGSA